MSEELIEEIPAEESVEEIAGEYPEIARRYKAGEELTDEELDTIADVAISIVRDLLGFFDAANSPIDEYEGDEGELILDITAPDLAVLIGRHGRTLESLQTIVSLLVSRKLGFRYPVSIDVEGYKSRRHDKVVSMAHSAASRAVAQGRTVNFENTVIIMTTNAGSNTRTGALGFGLSTDDQSRERAQRALNEFLRPEFLNRIDEIVYFNHLTEENFRAIAALMLDEVRAAMAERGMTLHWTPAVIDYLVRKGYSETYGARNLRRTIQRDVEDAIASAIVARRKAAGDIGIDAQDDHITVTINDREVNA